MKPHDRQRFCQGIAVLATNFRAEVTEAQLALLWLALRDELSLEQWEKAAARALRELEFFPSVGKVLELAGKKKRPGMRLIDGKPHVWLGEGAGWGEFHGSQASLSEPTPASDLIRLVMPPEPKR